MAANATLDASPPTDREGEPLKASPTLGDDNDSDDDVIFLGSRRLESHAPSPDDNKGGARARKRCSSALSTDEQFPCWKRRKALATEQYPTTPPRTSPVSPSASDAEPPALSLPDRRSDMQCPFCKKTVSEDYRSKLPRGYVPLSEQRRFCTEHKEDEAREEWTARGYPNIDWPNLDRRILPHINHLEDILSGKTDSHYRDILARDIKSGEVRDLLRLENDYVPGYYGSKGSRVMLEGVTHRLASPLREIAPVNRLVSAKGHTFYVQAVLVPELAVRLVMEDMEVKEEDARRILKESRHLGEMLCVDEGDDFDENDSNWF